MTLKEFSPERNLPLLPVYEALLIDGFRYGGNPFTRVEGDGDYCNELSSVACWNQELFDKNFELGWAQNSHEGYQQFLLDLL